MANAETKATKIIIDEMRFARSQIENGWKWFMNVSSVIRQHKSELFRRYFFGISVFHSFIDRDKSEYVYRIICSAWKTMFQFGGGSEFSSPATLFFIKLSLLSASTEVKCRFVLAYTLTSLSIIRHDALQQLTSIPAHSHSQCTQTENNSFCMSHFVRANEWKWKFRNPFKKLSQLNDDGASKCQRQ